jgi:N-acetylneuraminic acid mutarotase
MTKSDHPMHLGKWRPGKPCLDIHMEAGSLRVRNRIYVIGGYQTLTHMCGTMQIFDMEADTWSYGPPLPRGFPLSHAGLASDGRFLFFVSGQPGPACEPATNRTWAFDLESMTWQAMAPLPGARYAPLAEYIDGNLHVISGAIEDRETISNDHFIMRIRAPGTAATALPALEAQEWRKGPPIPAGGDHAASIVIDGKIYVIGGEHGHAAMTMDPAQCCGTYWVHNTLFRYDPRKEEWMRLADMPFGSSHIESQTVVIDGRILVLGGTADKDIFVDKVQQYDPALDRWRQLRPLPAGRKGGVVWEKDGVVYFNGGQIAPDRDKPYERDVVSKTMAARIGHSFWSRFF